MNSNSPCFTTVDSVSSVTMVGGNNLCATTWGGDLFMFEAKNNSGLSSTAQENFKGPLLASAFINDSCMICTSAFDKLFILSKGQQGFDSRTKVIRAIIPFLFRFEDDRTPYFLLIPIDEREIYLYRWAGNDLNRVKTFNLPSNPIYASFSNVRVPALAILLSNQEVILVPCQTLIASNRNSDSLQGSSKASKAIQVYINDAMKAVVVLNEDGSMTLNQIVEKSGSSNLALTEESSLQVFKENEIGRDDLLYGSLPLGENDLGNGAKANQFFVAASSNGIIKIVNLIDMKVFKTIDHKIELCFMMVIPDLSGLILGEGYCWNNELEGLKKSNTKNCLRLIKF